MRTLLPLFATAGLLALATPGCAQQPQAADPGATADTDLTEATCREVLTLSGEEKDFVIVFLHGFMVGAGGTTSYNTEIMGGITDSFLNSCIDRPSESALAVIREEYAKMN